MKIKLPGNNAGKVFSTGNGTDQGAGNSKGSGAGASAGGGIANRMKNFKSISVALIATTLSFISCGFGPQGTTTHGNRICDR